MNTQKKVEIRELLDSNLHDFFYLLNTRSSLDTNFYLCKYKNHNHYGGFIAYVDNLPAGCIGYVKRNVEIKGSINAINWFNDWFVDDKFRGLNLGVMLLKKVALKDGISCGIITPEKSGRIAPKAGFINQMNYRECRIPINLLKYSWNKYFRDNAFLDSVLKRLVRTISCFLKSFSFRFSKLKEFDYSLKELDNEMDYDFKSYTENGLLINDLKYLSFIMKALKNERDYRRDFWKLSLNDTTVFGYNEITPNNIRQTVIMLVINMESNGYKNLIEKMLVVFKKADVLNVILPENEAKEMGIDFVFTKKLPFFTYGFDMVNTKQIYHIDKESTWC